MSVENNATSPLSNKLISVRLVTWFIDLSPLLDKFKVQSASTGAKPLWRNKGTRSVISGVVTSKGTLRSGSKIFLRPHQQKLQSLK